MVRHSILILICLLCVCTTEAQKSVKGMPYSLQLPELKTTSAIPDLTFVMPEFDQTTIENPGPFPYGVYLDTIIDIKNSAISHLIAGRGKIWRLTLTCKEARSIQINFSTFRIPRDASLFLYDEGMNLIAGAFTNANIRNNSEFAISDFKGNHVVLEYFEPLNPEFEGKLVVSSLGFGFSNPIHTESGPGFINVNCPIGQNAQEAKHAVCVMSFRSGTFEVSCTGALINNARNDGTPYFLTANHCISTAAEAGSLQTHFNYESAGCNGEASTFLTLTGGAILCATGIPSDFTLLRLNDIPPPEYQPFYGGWDARDEAIDHVTGIHHPFNETKKISLDYDSIYSNPVSVNWDDGSRSPAGSHWIIGYDDGGTSQGSSGSPLFNSNDQIIGQLHGGDDLMSYYGKISNSFTYKAHGFHTMRHYLDPDSTGITVINGYAPSDNLPDAFFTTKYEEVCHNTAVAFHDKSVFGPYGRVWNIFPATYNFTGGTTDTSENPEIEFLQDTTYTVTLNLLVNGEIRSDEELKVTSGDNITVSVSSETGNNICDCDFESFNITADGAENFLWRILPGDEDKISLSDTAGSTITVHRDPLFETDSSYTAVLRVIGTQETCTDTVDIQYNLIRQINDDIENAFEINYGKSDTYTNLCATIQTDEPVPPFSSCTSQNSWCDEYGTGENIVENSVWFKFTASSTGLLSISSTGMDNEIALYEADSYQAILNGDYTILGANDDRSDSDYRPLIKSENVKPGETYWIQVDGSGGGLEGDFYISLTELTPTAINNNHSGTLVIYPQPAGEHVYISNQAWNSYKEISISILNPAGILISKSTYPISDGKVSIDSGDWLPGVYIVVAETQKSRYAAQIVKK